MPSPGLRLAAALTLLAAAPAPADDAAKRRPTTFAVVYNQGYAGDHLPAEPEPFEKLVAAAKAAHFTVILCPYEPWRADVCKKHGVKLFVDLVAPKHHVYKAPDEAKKLCESLKGNEVVYGYHLWSDNITDATVAGRTRDAKNVREWDPTHPVYVGTTAMNRIGRVEGPDVFGYYDFHWKRGGHWEHLTKARGLAEAKKVPFLRYDDATSGIVGKGNVNRVGYTFATSVPFGLKGYLYHYAGPVIDPKTFALTPLGEDVKKVNARFAAVGDELMKVGVSSAVYSTPITKSAKNDPVPAGVPAGLTAVPADHWFRVAAGEVLVGQFADAEKRDVLVFANHNPYESQAVRLEVPGGAKSAEVFDRAARKWAPLKPDGKAFKFQVEDYGVELVRLVR
ncbi:MAG: hypothetical protein C0501_11535 [Isosphaera sp.]|nr:hypothetical protein [Isosphaera sp.]